MLQQKTVAHDMNGPLEEEAIGEVPSWDGAAWEELGRAGNRMQPHNPAPP